MASKALPLYLEKVFVFFALPLLPPNVVFPFWTFFTSGETIQINKSEFYIMKIKYIYFINVYGNNLFTL